MNNNEHKYNLLFVKLMKIREKNNTEEEHIFQDTIYRKFIKDICNNKLKTLKIMKKITRDINTNVVKYDKNMWYS